MNLNRQQRRVLVLVLSAVIIIVYVQTQKRGPDPVPVAATPTPSVAAPIETVNACFARKRIEKGTNFDDLNIPDLIVLEKNVPKDKIPGGVASDLRQVYKRVATEDVEKGEPIILSRFLDPRETGRVSDHIPKESRAITLRIDKIHGVAGFLKQGDFVDIIGSFTVEGRNLTKYVLPKVKILAVNTEFQAGGGGPGDQVEPGASPAPGGSPAPAGASPAPTAAPSPSGPPGERGRILGQDITLVTFQVTPTEAERLVVASEHARLYLVLRNPNDPGTPPIAPVDAVDVYVERPKKPAVPKYDIDVLRGAVRNAIPVRLAPADSTESTTDRRIYFDPKEETIRQIKEEDFSIQPR